MDLSVIFDTLTISTSQGLGFAKLILDRHQCLVGNGYLPLSSDSTVDNFGINAALVPIDMVAPPVKPNSYKKLAKTLLRRKRRTKRTFFSNGDSNDDEDYELFFSSDGGDGCGPFGGGCGGWNSGGGSGWNFGGFGGRNWDESSSSSSWKVTALDFVYEVIFWIALSNCVHFAFKKAVRIVTNGIDDAGHREKVPLRLASVC